MGIEEIRVINDFNVRANQLNQGKIAEYADIYERLPHVSVFEVDGELYLVDGWHRMEAARRLKKESITCTLIGKGSLVEAQDEADKANLTHGVMLTAEQRKEIAKRFLSRHNDWTAREVAKVMGVHNSTIVRWTNEEDLAANAAVDDSEKPNLSAASQEKRAATVDVMTVRTAYDRWYNKELKVKPLALRSQQWKDAAKQALKPIADTYNAL